VVAWSAVMSTSAERTAEYRRRRWAHLEQLMRRVVREELELARAIDRVRAPGGQSVDTRRGPAVDNVTRAYARAVRDRESGSSGTDSSGDSSPAWSAEDELFPGFRRSREVLR
jgi:hypothetical protein